MEMPYTEASVGLQNPDFGFDLGVHVDPDRMIIVRRCDIR
jgi:hypothetical protein